MNKPIQLNQFGTSIKRVPFDNDASIGDSVPRGSARSSATRFLRAAIIAGKRSSGIINRWGTVVGVGRGGTARRGVVGTAQLATAAHTVLLTRLILFTI